MITALLLAAALGYAHPEELVDVTWVAAHAHDADVRLLDLRRSGYEAGHIPGAVWLDPESIRDVTNTPYYLMRPAAFETAMGRLGIANATHVVIYDDRGGLLASRLWWMLRVYGHTRVSLVNGGWTAWMAVGHPVTTEVVPPAAARFRAARQPGWVATLEDVRAAIARPGTRIVDARTQAEMDGTDIRLSARGGVIPSAVGLYWEDLLDPATKTFKPADELQALFTSRGLTPADTIVAYCWVGHRSAVDLFALHLLGYERLQNYLGSWEEWSRRADLPTTPPAK